MESKPADEEQVGSDIAQQEGNAGSEYDDHEVNTFDNNKINIQSKNLKVNKVDGEIIKQSGH